MSQEDQRKELLKQQWPVVHKNPPQPWTVPLVMTAKASIPFVRLTERNEQLFKNNNMEATMEISIDVPAWLLKDFSGMVHSLEGTTLEFYMYRFHFGSLTVKDWEDQSFQVTFCPHFPLVAYTDETQNDKISYARMAFVKDYGVQP
jgi:hypothetical protein